jgi:hypothetical protein
MSLSILFDDQGSNFDDLKISEKMTEKYLKNDLKIKKRPKNSSFPVLFSF